MKNADAAAAKAAALTKKIPVKKVKKLHMIIGGVVFLVAIVVWYGMQPLQGPITVGICRTFIEFRTTYPQTIKIISYENMERAVRLYYTFTGSFGEFRSNMVDCKFGIDPTTGSSIIEEVRINRELVDPEQVTAFNATLPVVVAAEPDLIVPYPLNEESLGNLKTD